MVRLSLMCYIEEDIHLGVIPQTHLISLASYVMYLDNGERHFVRDHLQEFRLSRNSNGDVHAVGLCKQQNWGYPPIILLTEIEV